MSYLNTPADEVSKEEIFANEDNYHRWNYVSMVARQKNSKR